MDPRSVSTMAYGPHPPRTRDGPYRKSRCMTRAFSVGRRLVSPAGCHAASGAASSIAPPSRAMAASASRHPGPIGRSDPPAAIDEGGVRPADRRTRAPCRCMRDGGGKWGLAPGPPGLHSGPPFVGRPGACPLFSVGEPSANRSSRSWRAAGRSRNDVARRLAMRRSGSGRGDPRPGPTGPPDEAGADSSARAGWAPMPEIPLD